MLYVLVNSSHFIDVYNLWDYWWLFITTLFNRQVLWLVPIGLVTLQMHQNLFQLAQLVQWQRRHLSVSFMHLTVRLLSFSCLNDVIIKHLWHSTNHCSAVASDLVFKCPEIAWAAGVDVFQNLIGVLCYHQRKRSVSIRIKDQKGGILEVRIMLFEIFIYAADCLDICVLYTMRNMFFFCSGLPLYFS